MSVARSSRCLGGRWKSLSEDFRVKTHSCGTRRGFKWLEAYWRSFSPRNAVKWSSNSILLWTVVGKTDLLDRELRCCPGCQYSKPTPHTPGHCSRRFWMATIHCPLHPPPTVRLLSSTRVSCHDGRDQFRRQREKRWRDRRFVHVSRAAPDSGRSRSTTVRPAFHL